MIEIYGIKTASRFSKKELTSLLQLVSERKREKLAGYVRWQDQQRSLLGDLLVRFLIKKQLNLINGEIMFSYTEKGKPYLNSFPEFQFSISHSGAWVVCAIDRQPLGIDVQRVGDLDLDIASRYFSAAENNDLLSCAERERRLYFFKLWGFYGCYLKAVGQGITEPLGSFNIARKDGDMFGVHKEGQWLNNFQLRLYQLSASYPLAVCATTSSFPRLIQIIDWQQCVYH